MKILLVEDERALSRALCKILEKSYYVVDPVYDGEEALEYLHNTEYDAVILDVMLPRINGFEVLRTIRKEGNETPVLILSARGEVDDKVRGLDSGANYYIAKPFDTKELLAGLRAITRAKPGVEETKLQFGNLTLDCASYELISPTASIPLAKKEFQMMELLFSNPHCLISAERILGKIWGYDSGAEINVVWVYISYLRKKMTALGSNVRIRAVRNAGYVLEEST